MSPTTLNLKDIKSVTASELQTIINALLDEVIATGEPLDISRDGKSFQILYLGEHKSKFDNLVKRPDVIVGDPEDLVNTSWEHELNLDLP